MKNDAENWIATVFDSIRGMQRAKPDPGLFAKIEQQLYAPETSVIPMRQWRLAAAAAVLLLVLNVVTMHRYRQSAALSSTELRTDDGSTQQLISDYNLYE
jgi:hypothetical protein